MVTFIIRKFTWPDPEKKEDLTFIEIIFSAGQRREENFENIQSIINAGYYVGQQKETSETFEILFPQEQKIQRRVEKRSLKYISGLSKEEIENFYAGFKQGFIARVNGR